MRWRSRVGSAVVVLLTLGAIAAGLEYGMSGDGTDRLGTVTASGGASPASLVGSWPAPKKVAVPTPVADGIVPKIALFYEPNLPFPLGFALDNPTKEGLPVVFHVVAHRGSWLQARGSMRPTETIAWIHASDVTRREVPNQVKVELAAHRLTVTHGDDVLMSEPVV